MQTMEITILVLLMVLIVFIAVTGYLFYRQNKRKETTPVIPQNDDQLKMLESLNSNLSAQYQSQQAVAVKNAENWKDTVGKVSENSQKFIELKQEVGLLKNDQLKRLMESQQQTLGELTNLINNVKRVDSRVLDLNNIFYNTKKRGNVGEFVLETLLTNLLGNNKKVWESQYELYTDANSSHRGVVDFVIHTVNKGEDIIIDAKFPLDNYRALLNAIEAKENKITVDGLKDDFKKDIKSKINEVTKYLNKKNNLNSVILFIPSESIFNFVVDEFEDVVQIAISKKVWLTSPTGLAALLNIINEYLKDYELNNNLEKIKVLIEKIQPDFMRFATRWEKIKSDINHLEKSVKDLDYTVDQVTKKQQKIIDYKFDQEENEAS